MAKAWERAAQTLRFVRILSTITFPSISIPIQRTRGLKEISFTAHPIVAMKEMDYPPLESVWRKNISMAGERGSRMHRSLIILLHFANMVCVTVVPMTDLAMAD